MNRGSSGRRSVVISVEYVRTRYASTGGAAGISITEPPITRDSQHMNSRLCSYQRRNYRRDLAVGRGHGQRDPGVQGLYCARHKHTGRLARMVEDKGGSSCGRRPGVSDVSGAI